MFFRISCRRLAAAIAALVVVACGGTIEADIYEPIRAGKPDRHRPHAATISLGDASLVLLPVDVSEERISVIYGPFLILPTFEEKKLIDKPLRIEVWLEIPRGSAVADLSRAKVSLGSRTLYPTSVGRHWTGERFEGPMQLTGQSTAHIFELNYAIRTTELEPFTLHLPDIQLNGRVVAIEPVAYRRGRRERPG